MPEDISDMKECKIPAWAMGKKVPAPTGGFFVSRTAIFQRRASF
jgi:hypothetical protein